MLYTTTYMDVKYKNMKLSKKKSGSAEEIFKVFTVKYVGDKKKTIKGFICTYVLWINL